MKSKPASVLCALLAAACLPACADGTDDFNDDSKNSQKWGNDDTSGRGRLTEANGRLEYTCTLPSAGDDDAYRPWNLTRFPYASDWQIQVDVTNNATSSIASMVNSAGLSLIGPNNANHEVYLELYGSSIGGPPLRKGFNVGMSVNGSSVGGNDSGEVSVTNGALLMHWNGTTKVLTCSYDSNSADGYQWIQLATLGLAGSGGADGNGNWGLGPADHFFVSLYGYSSAMVIASGQLHLDNFSETGGVASGGSRPDPVGRFPFRFPTGNPLITRIINLTGNYRGVSPTAAQRNFTIDAAQDESGRIAVMGTADGIATRNGEPVVSGNIGSVATVNNEPVVELKGQFEGRVDGQDATFKGSGSAPVEVVDIGGGTDGVAGTGSYQSKVGGVPLSGKNVAFQAEAPPESVANANANWSLQLDIAGKEVGGKPRTVASAELTLPNGDVIRFPERTVKYSATKGYNLTFKGGTNVTADPDRADKKTSVVLRGLKFTQQGAVWHPSAGTIDYRFLGQQGQGNLMDFLEP